MTSDTPELLVGESLLRLPDGRVQLTMRSGKVRTFSVDEWEEYNAEYMETMFPTDAIDILIKSVSGRQIVPSSEIVDALLDLRNRCAGLEKAAETATSMWITAMREKNNNES